MIIDVMIAGLVVGGTLSFLSPLFRIISRTVIRDRMNDRKKEWRLMAIKLAVVEYQAITFINGVRGMLGQHELGTVPTLEASKDWKWRDLMNDAKMSVTKAITDIKARWEVTQ